MSWGSHYASMGIPVRGAGLIAMDEVFVGREVELAFLRGRLEETLAGMSRTVLLEGAAGVGKTALLEAFLARAGHHRVLRTSGAELEAGLAYGVLDQLVAETASRHRDGWPDSGPNEPLMLSLCVSEVRWSRCSAGCGAAARSSWSSTMPTGEMSLRYRRLNSRCDAFGPARCWRCCRSVMTEPTSCWPACTGS